MACPLSCLLTARACAGSKGRRDGLSVARKIRPQGSVAQLRCRHLWRQGPLFGAWGKTDATEARRLIDICLDAGVTLFDTADVYSDGASEEVLGEAIRNRRDKVLISTKTGLPMGEGPAEAGTSRARLLPAVEASLRRLGTDYIDLLQLHAFDAATPFEEVLATLDELVRAGKVRYIGVSISPAGNWRNRWE
jgi:aryl-alcohol dehydrogenase-like predicted oxidoreductase